MSIDPAVARAQLKRLASSTNPETAALAQIMQSLVPGVRQRASNIQGIVEIDDTTVIAKSALDVDYQAAMEVIQKTMRGYNTVGKPELWVSLSASPLDGYKRVAPESWRELLPLINKVKIGDPHSVYGY